MIFMIFDAFVALVACYVLIKAIHVDDGSMIIMSFALTAVFAGKALHNGIGLWTPYASLFVAMGGLIACPCLITIWRKLALRGEIADDVV